MTEMHALFAYDLLTFAEGHLQRLAKVGDQLADHRAMKSERAWVAQAADLMERALSPAKELKANAHVLPELAELREELAMQRQGLWVDALERLLAGITFHAGSRAPLIETLFPHQKFPQLRKAAKESVTQYWADLDRRRKSSYAQRMLGQADFAFAAPVLEQVDAAYTAWLESGGPVSTPSDVIVAVRGELVRAGEALELAIRQSRLLAEAALAAEPDAYERSGLSAKPKRRSAKAPASAPLVASMDDLPDEPAPPSEIAAAEPAPAPPRKAKKARAQAPAVPS